MLKRTQLLFELLILCTATAGWLPRRPAMDMDAQTPEALVQTYSTLADTILGAKQTEWHLVDAILGTTYSHALGTLGRVQMRLDAGESVEDDLELLAALVAQLGNEGDAAVAGVRKRLIEGGHHHNAEGERQGVYEEGYVIVTRAAKQVFLTAAEDFGRLAQAPDADAIDSVWDTVTETYESLPDGD